MPRMNVTLRPIVREYVTQQAKWRQQSVSATIDQLLFEHMQSPTPVPRNTKAAGQAPQDVPPPAPLTQIEVQAAVDWTVNFFFADLKKAIAKDTDDDPAHRERLVALRKIAYAWFQDGAEAADEQAHHLVMVGELIDGDPGVDHLFARLLRYATGPDVDPRASKERRDLQAYARQAWAANARADENE